MEDTTDSFAEFKRTYPKRIGLFFAERIWRALELEDPNLPQRIMERLRVQIKDRLYSDWQFWPSPANYLSGRRWEDETPQEAARERAAQEHRQYCEHSRQLAEQWKVAQDEHKKPDPREKIWMSLSEDHREAIRQRVRRKHFVFQSKKTEVGTIMFLTACLAEMDEIAKEGRASSAPARLSIFKETGCGS
jgi:hypothetical protein